MMFLIHLLITVYLLTLSNFVSSASFGSSFLDELRNVVDQLACYDEDIVALPKEEYWRIQTALYHYDAFPMYSKEYKIDPETLKAMSSTKYKTRSRTLKAMSSKKYKTDPKTLEAMYAKEYKTDPKTLKAMSSKKYKAHPRALYAKTWLVKHRLGLDESPHWGNAIGKCNLFPYKFHATYRIVDYESLNSLLSSSNPGDVVVIDSRGRCFPMPKDAASGEFTVEDDVYFSLPTVHAETLINLIRQTREKVKPNGRIYPIVYACNNDLWLMIVDANLTLLAEAPICSVERSRYYPPEEKPTQRGALNPVTKVAKVYDDGLV